MATLIRQLTGLLCLAAIGSGTLYAQKPSEKKEDNIIIRRKGSGDEKMTIVIDGDNITVNGKPFDKQNDSTIEIQRFKEFNRLRLNGSRPPFPPELAGRIKGTPRISIGATVNRAVLGVVTEKDDKGARITEITPESGAAKAGLQKDDIITAVNDTTVADQNDLSAVVRKYKPEDKITVTYLRNGKKNTTTAILGKNRMATARSFHWNNDNDEFHFDMPELAELPRVEGFSFDGKGFGNRDMLVLGKPKPRLGLQVQDTEEGNGVKVLEVGPESPATKAGVEKGDIVTGVNGKKIQSVDELREELKEVKEGDTVTVDVLRGKEKKSLQVKFPKKLKTTNL